MVRFIDDHRDVYGVELICAAVPIAPSTYVLHQAPPVDPTQRSAGAQRDDGLRVEIQRVWDANHQVYGPRKVWRQPRRAGHRVARCTVRRLMRALGLAGAGHPAGQESMPRCDRAFCGLGMERMVVSGIDLAAAPQLRSRKLGTSRPPASVQQH